MINIDYLERLHRLHQAGALTTEEFEREKEKILNNTQQVQQQNVVTYQPMPPHSDKEQNAGYTVALHLILVIPVLGWLAEEMIIKTIFNNGSGSFFYFYTYKLLPLLSLLFGIIVWAMWHVKKVYSPLARQHGATLMNLLISSFIYAITFIAINLCIDTFWPYNYNHYDNYNNYYNDYDEGSRKYIDNIMYFAFYAFFIATLVYIVINALRANKGQPARYPMAIKFLKDTTLVDEAK